MDNFYTRTKDEAEKLRIQLEGLVQRFTDQVAQFLGRWYGETVKKFVVMQPEQTKALGTRIENLRRETDAVANDMANQMREVLKNPRLWPHRSGQDIAVLGVDKSGRALPRAFYDALEPHTSENLRENLARYGYNMPHVPLELPHAIIATMNEYVTTLMQWARLEADIGNADESRARAEAAELWERAKK